MIHNDIQNQLALLVKVSAPPLIDVADSPLEAPQWVPGQKIPAHVMASMPNGRFQVQIENQILDMNLPRNSQPGDTLELTFIASSPRLTFALAPELEKALPMLANRANSNATFSDTARFLGALLQKGGAANSHDPQAQNTLSAAGLDRAAIVPGEPPATREFAQALRAAVSQSGLFYESHQAQWVTGERTLASLMQEPQARLPVLDPAQPQPANNPPSGLASLTRAGPLQAQELTAAVRNTDLSPPSLDGQNALNVRDPVHQLAQPIVQQQLDTLESRQIVWQGPVWPGQQMEWQIDEDGSPASQDEQDAPRWRTRLHLEMPGLGGVTAKLMMDGQGIHVDFFADTDKTAALMRDDIANLAQSMESVGLKVAGLAVNQDGAA